mmetsp:Transcript_98731/g.279663  ORF Transcript_98731/g.279663 Transcript_98731/m.279663 type:complete len:248 (+) Transcript_98731:1581-2324(+)
MAGQTALRSSEHKGTVQHHNPRPTPISQFLTCGCSFRVFLSSGGMPRPGQRRRRRVIRRRRRKRRRRREQRKKIGKIKRKRKTRMLSMRSRSSSSSSSNKRGRQVLRRREAEAAKLRGLGAAGVATRSGRGLDGLATEVAAPAAAGASAEAPREAGAAATAAAEMSARAKKVLKQRSRGTEMGRLPQAGAPSADLGVDVASSISTSVTRSCCPSFCEGGPLHAGQNTASLQNPFLVKIARHRGLSGM